LANIFGIPILIAIGLGILFPYIAFELVPFGAVFLVLLMYLAGLTIDWNNFGIRKAFSPAIVVGILFLFIIFPVCQWVIAKTLVKDSQYLYGLVLASLCPVAIVAPFFTKSIEADTELSFTLVVVSMLIFPIISPPVLELLAGKNTNFSSAPVTRYMILLTTIPVLFGYLTYRFCQPFVDSISKHIGLANMLCLSALIFILFGTAARRINIHYTDYSEILVLLLLVFIQNFAVLALSKTTFSLFFGAKQAFSMAVSLSMKNYAIAAGILLFYDPKASLVPALGFVAHAFLFNVIYLTRKTSYFRPSSAS